MTLQECMTSARKNEIKKEISAFADRNHGALYDAKVYHFMALRFPDLSIKQCDDIIDEVIGDRMKV